MTSPTASDALLAWLSPMTDDENTDSKHRHTVPPAVKGRCRMTSPTASDAFLGSLTSMTSDEDMDGILDAQSHMLRRFEKTNEMLSNFNSLSSQRYVTVNQQFTAHTQMLLEVKSDLDGIFRRLRQLKVKLGKDYPRAFTAASEDAKPLDLGEDEDDGPRPHAAGEGDQSKPGGQGSSGDNTVPEAVRSDSIKQELQCKQTVEEDELRDKEPPVYLVD